MNSFNRTKQPETNTGFIPNFIFDKNLKVPVLILDAPADKFPEGVPIVRRHWVKNSQTGKFSPPMTCTQGNPSTDGNCLCCWASSTGVPNLLIDEKTGRASEEYVIPLYDFGMYIKMDDGKTKLIDTTIFDPTKDPALRERLSVGGFKTWYCSPWQFQTLQKEQRGLENVCADCGGDMQIKELCCSECDDRLMSGQDLVMLDQTSFESVVFGDQRCRTCGFHGLPKIVRECTACGGSRTRTVFDTVLNTFSAVVSKPDGSTRTEYRLSAVLDRPIDVEATADEWSNFWTKLHREATYAPSIAKQAERLGIQPPQAWLQKSIQNNSRPYGQ